MKRITAGVLDVAYREAGPEAGNPVILLHGFPYDIHALDQVADRLAAAGKRCLIPFLRGYGPTTFLRAETPRSGQQAALGADLLPFMDALALPAAVLAGDDRGGRAACVVAGLRPARPLGLVSCGIGYSIQDIAKAGSPGAPEQEHRHRYQYYWPRSGRQPGPGPTGIATPAEGSNATSRRRIAGGAWRTGRASGAGT